MMIDDFIQSTIAGKTPAYFMQCLPNLFYPINYSGKKTLLVATDKSRRSFLKHSLGYIKRISCVSNLFFYPINYSGKTPASGNISKNAEN